METSILFICLVLGIVTVQTEFIIERMQSGSDVIELGKDGKPNIKTSYFSDFDTNSRAECKIPQGTTEINKRLNIISEKDNQLMCNSNTETLAVCPSSAQNYQIMEKSQKTLTLCKLSGKIHSLSIWVGEQNGWKEYSGRLVENELNFEQNNNKAINIKERTKWDGLLVKILYRCETSRNVYSNYCLVVKFTGKRKYPLPSQSLENLLSSNQVRTEPTTKPTDPSIVNTSPEPESSSSTGIIIGVVFACFFILFLVVLLFLLYRRKRRSNKNSNKRQEPSSAVYAKCEVDVNSTPEENENGRAALIINPDGDSQYATPDQPGPVYREIEPSNYGAYGDPDRGDADNTDGEPSYQSAKEPLIKKDNNTKPTNDYNDIETYSMPDKPKSLVEQAFDLDYQAAGEEEGDDNDYYSAPASNETEILTRPRSDLYAKVDKEKKHAT